MSPLRLIPIVFLPLLLGALSALPEQGKSPATAQVPAVEAARLVATQPTPRRPVAAAPAQVAEVRIVPIMGSNVPEMGR